MIRAQKLRAPAMATASLSATTSRELEPHSDPFPESSSEASSSSSPRTAETEAEARLVSCDGGAQENVLTLDSPWVATAEAESRLDEAAMATAASRLCLQAEREANDDETRNNQEREEEEPCNQDKKEAMQSRLASFILSLCGMVYHKLVSEGSDLTPQFDNAYVFLNTLKKIVVKKGSSIVEREDVRSLIQELFSASKNMLGLSTTSSSTSRFPATMKLDKRTLPSLVKEAEELYNSLPSTSRSG